VLSLQRTEPLEVAKEYMSAQEAASLFKPKKLRKKKSLRKKVQQNAVYICIVM
jgi:hypothetical protein